MPRKSYKALYLHAAGKLTVVREQTALLTRELDRLHGVLAEHAREETIPSMNNFLQVYPHATEIPLYPVSFEAMRAAMRKELPFKENIVEQLGADTGLVNLSWRGKPLVCKP